MTRFSDRDAVVEEYPGEDEKEIKVSSDSLLREMKRTPLNYDFGFSRGTPIDRYYIDDFLNKNKSLIRGDVLEIAENTYTKKFGSLERVEHSWILHVDAQGKNIIHGDFETGEGIQPNSMDCIILTQTLPFMYHLESAVKNIYGMLKKDGSLLVTVAGLCQISRYDMDRWGDYWRFTDLSLRKLMESVAEPEKIDICTYGNVKSACALLYGAASEELAEEDLKYSDPDYQVSICAVVRH